MQEIYTHAYIPYAVLQRVQIWTKLGRLKIARFRINFIQNTQIINANLQLKKI